MRWGLNAATILVMSIATPAWAQSLDAGQRRYSLAWVRGAGAEDCPPAAELQREVEQRIGRPLFDIAAPQSIEASVQRDDHGASPTRRSEIHVRDSDGTSIGERTLTSTEVDCRSLFSSTALAIALLVDPDAAALRAPRAGTATPFAALNAKFGTPYPNATPGNGQPSTAQFAAAQNQPNAAYARTPNVEVATNQPNAKDSPKSKVAEPAPAALAHGAENSGRFAQLSASSVVGIALLPTTEIGAAIGMRAWETPTIGFGLSAFYLPMGKGESRGNSSVAVGLTAFQAALMLELLSSDHVRLLAELGPSVGALQVTVRGSPATGPSECWFVAARSELSAQLKLSTKTHIELALAGLLPLVRNRLVDTSSAQSELFRQSSISAVGRIGIGIQFP